MNNFFLFVIGASIGSFLNVLIDRLPKHESINGRSHCDHCRKKLAWYDLIPIMSFFAIGARCRYCRKSLSWQYPFIETLTGTVFLLIFNFQFSPLRQDFEGQTIFNQGSIAQISNLIALIALLGIASCFIVIFVSDIKYHLISDYLLAALLIFSSIFHLKEISQFPNFLLSGLFVGFPIYLIYYFSRERAMGLGDVYLSAVIGFLLGWKQGFLGLYIAFVTGAIYGLLLIILRRKKMKSKIPFGPFLVVGAVMMLFSGNRIIEVFSLLFGF